MSRYSDSAAAFEVACERIAACAVGQGEYDDQAT